MGRYLRAKQPGGINFFTLVTAQRRPLLTTASSRRILRQSIENVRCKRPFDILAFVLLPDHLHTIWQLPQKDDDFSTR
nr:MULTISPECIES: transposase [Pirellulaceae]